jgi:hypothetical protein
MFKAITWCAKCLFIYLIVVILSTRLAWIFTLPVWSVAVRFHWTEQNRVVFSLNYFLIIFAVIGFVIGLLPWHRLGRAYRAITSRPLFEAATGIERVPAILWAWVPVTVAFLVRYFTWSSKNSSVLDPHGAITTGRFARFFGTLNMQNASLVDPKWGSDRFMFTAPMLFLMACALAVALRRRLTKPADVVAAEVHVDEQH